MVDPPRRCAAASTRVAVDETNRVARSIRSAITPLVRSHTGTQSHRPAHGRMMGSPEGSHLVSIVGAAWLLISQPAVTETRTLGRSAPQRGEASGETGPRREPSNVTIIELRRPASAAQDEAQGASGRQYRRRWWSEDIGVNRRAARAGHSASRYGCRPMSRAPRVHRWSQKRGCTSLSALTANEFPDLEVGPG